MRLNPAIYGSIVHVVQRGARGLDIVRDTALASPGLLFYLNDSFSDPTG